jgi:hypothetical protein
MLALAPALAARRRRHAGCDSREAEEHLRLRIRPPSDSGLVANRPRWIIACAQ